MGALFLWSWPAALLGYLWLVLLAGVLHFWQRRRLPEKRVSVFPPLAFCAIATALQQATLLAAVATQLIQSWHGVAILVVELGGLVAAGVLWLRTQSRGLPLRAPPFAALLGAVALPLVFTLVNGAGWSAAPAERPVVVEFAHRNSSGPLRYSFVRLAELGEVAVPEESAALFREGEKGVATLGRGLLGGERLTGLRLP